MNDTIGNENVGSENTGVVDKHVATDNSSCKISTLERSNTAAVHEVGTIKWLTSGDNMVLKDLCQICRAQVCEVAADSLKGCVVRDEVGKIALTSQSLA